MGTARRNRQQQATSIVKLTWNLSRRLALIGSTGTEQAVDVRYVFSFK